MSRTLENELFAGLNSLLLDIGEQTRQKSYPPYDVIQVDETKSQIVLAVAGYRREDVQISTSEGTLKITGDFKKEEKEIAYLKRGIARRSFELKFNLEAYNYVQSAELVDGLLTINIERILPEELKPKTINIGGVE